MIWKCPQCNTDNASYDVICSCGFELKSEDKDDNYFLESRHTSNKNHAVSFECPKTLISKVFGLIFLLCGVLLCFLIEKILSMDALINQSPFFVFGMLCALFFFIYKFVYAGMRNLNLLRLKGVYFQDKSILFKFKNEDIKISKVLNIKHKRNSIIILGRTNKGSNIELKIKKNFFVPSHNREVFSELLSNYS